MNTVRALLPLVLLLPYGYLELVYVSTLLDFDEPQNQKGSLKVPAARPPQAGEQTQWRIGVRHLVCVLGICLAYMSVYAHDPEFACQYALGTFLCIFVYGGVITVKTFYFLHTKGFHFPD